MRPATVFGECQDAEGTIQTEKYHTVARVIWTLVHVVAGFDVVRRSDSEQLAGFELTHQIVVASSIDLEYAIYIPYWCRRRRLG